MVAPPWRSLVAHSAGHLALGKTQLPRADLKAYDRYGEAVALKTVRSVIDVPFSQGTLALSSAEPNAFSEQDIDVLQNMAGLLNEGFQRMADLQALYRAMAEAEQAAEAAHAANRAKSRRFN